MQEFSQRITKGEKAGRKSKVPTKRFRGVRKPKVEGKEKKARLIRPLTSSEVINRVKLEASAMKNGQQKYILILIGLNTGLRISDILKLRVSDFRGKDRLVLYEQKTGKRTDIALHPILIHDVEVYSQGKADNDLLFASRQKRKAGKPIDYVTAYRWVKAACAAAGVGNYVGCHTLRKTYGYTMYKKYRDVGALMKRFNHSSQTVTLRYIGISQELEDERAKQTFI